MMKDERTNAFWYPLALHPQYAFHGDAVIMGTVEGLIALRAVIDAALTTGQSATGMTFDPGDGEGYALHVLMVPKEDLGLYIGNNYSSDFAKHGTEERSPLGQVYSTKMHPVLDVEQVKKQFGPLVVEKKPAGKKKAKK